MKLRVIAALCVVVLLAADREKDELEGTWLSVSIVRDGTDAGPPPPGAKVVHKNGTSFSVVGDDEPQKSMDYKLDASQKPKSIDITPAVGPAKGKVMKGIYEIDGDTLRVCLPTDPAKANDRPTKFASEKGSGLILLTFKRAKK